MSVGLYSGTSGLSLGVGLWSGVPGFWSGAAGLIDGLGAALDLNFLAGAPLDSRITFTRGSQATLTDSTGKITYAPNNLLTNSESFEATAWNKVNATMTANATAAPDGTNTADALVEDGTTAAHYVQQFISYVAGVSYTFSVYLKAGIRSWVEIDFPSSAFGVAQGGYFNLTGSGSLGNAIGSPTARTITAVGNGWYRVSVTATATATAGGNTPIIAASANGTTSYAGSNGSTALSMWGAQVEAVTYQTTPSTYNSTTPKNLLGYTQEFDNAAWTKTNATITANAIAAPDGTLSADKLVEDTANSSHRASQGITTTVSPYTFSVYLKAAERSFALIYTGTVNTGVMVNLSTGATNVVAGITAPSSSSVTAVGNGWHRCSITFTATAATNVMFVYAAINSTTYSYTGDGTSGIYVWGAQLSNSASVDPYVYNPGAAPTSTAYYGPRFDYDPVTLAPKGLLIEEQRTNLLVRSEEFDNAAWTKSNATISANATTSPDGTVDADKLVENTAASVFHYANQAVTKAASAIQYTATCYVKDAGRQVQIYLQSGSNGVVGRVNPADGTVTSAAAAFGAGWTAGTLTTTSVGNGWWRVTLVATSDTTTSIVLQFALHNGSTNVYTGNGTSGVFIYGAQLEAGAFATSYIPTVASQVTRSADVATMTGTNFSSWYNQTQGTLLVEGSVYSTGLSGNRKTLATITEGNFNNVSRTAVEGATSAGGSVSSGGVTQAAFTVGSAVAANTPFKMALAMKANDFAFCANGGAVSTDTSGSVVSAPIVLDLGFGPQNSSGSTNTAGDYLNGHIRSISYFNTRLPDATLQSLTA